ncbi:MAG: protein-methionine-sulfoxide reductase heme-binding subunit MsrQ [Acidobacteriota bacterium]
MTANQTIRWVFKPAVFLASLIPLGLLVQRLLNGNLGADPLKEITNQTGLWALRLLCLTLVMTPLRRLTGWNAAIRFRRMLGLYAFFYGTVHFLIFIVADRLASLGFPSLAEFQTWRALAVSISEEILKRPYITVGFTSWLCMLALALTSTSGMIRRLGGKRWQLLHRAIYVAAVAGVVHFWWLVKADVREPQLYTVIVAALLGFRLVWWLRTRRRAAVASQRVKKPM